MILPLIQMKHPYFYKAAGAIIFSRNRESRVMKWKNS